MKHGYYDSLSEYIAPEQASYLEDRVKALRDERAVLLRSLSEAQASTRYWREVAEERLAIITQQAVELQRGPLVEQLERSINERQQ